MTVIYREFRKANCQATVDTVEFVNKFFRDDDCFVFSADILGGRHRCGESETIERFFEIGVPLVQSPKNRERREGSKGYRLWCSSGT